MINGQTCFGVIVGNRGFFPAELARQGHEFFSSLLERLGYSAIMLTDNDTKFGSVETWQDAKKCAGLFAAHRGEIDGVIVTLPNFGDERGVADTIKRAGLDVPVLVHAWEDEPGKMAIANRRDSFCGKMSACNNLVQYNIPFSLTALHTMDPGQQPFERDLHWFAAVCRVVNGLRKCRVGALGARPAAFNTVRFSEKLLQESGISVETLDLSEALGRSNALDSASPEVGDRLAKIRAYATIAGSPPDSALIKMAKLGIVIDRWMDESELDAIAVQCWTAIEDYFGIYPCTVMSMLSERLRPAACEVDVCGAVAMHALALAMQHPSYLLDWNNNYGSEPGKCVCFHCSNLPKSALQDPAVDYNQLIADSTDKNNTYGIVRGRIKPGPLTYARISTFDSEGMIGAYVGEGRFTDDPLETFGGYGVAEIPNMQILLEYICENGFEHHVAMTHGQCARALFEAFDTYMGWDVYWRQG